MLQELAVTQSGVLNIDFLRHHKVRWTSKLPNNQGRHGQAGWENGNLKTYTYLLEDNHTFSIVEGQPER